MRKYLLGVGAFIVAFGVLSISVLRSASPKYSFATPRPAPTIVLGASIGEIDYSLPYPGGILPDNPLWTLKALRDKIWYTITSNHLKKAELDLLFADKRLGSSLELMQKNKPDVAISTLSKGEKYLEMASAEENIARKEGMDTSSFLVKLALSSLKHREIIEEQLIPIAPEDGKPDIVKTEDYAKNAYKSARDALNNKGLPVPESPFSGD